MDKKILQFAILLRKAGIKVSHSEVSECLYALVLVGVGKGVFYNTLVSTLVKDQADYVIFDKVFSWFFQPDFFDHSQQKDLFPGLFPEPDELNSQCMGNDELLAAENSRTSGFGQGRGLATAAVENFIQVIKLGDVGEMTRMVSQGLKSLGRIKIEDLENMKEPIRQVKVFLEWNMGTDRLEQEAGIVDEESWLTWQINLKKMEGILYREMEKALVGKFGDKALDIILARENINEIDFFRLSVPQINEIKKRISKLAHKLATRLAFRYKRAKKGKIDLSRTIRKVVAYGGVPISPEFRGRYPTKPEFVVLCDISGSVKLFSEFMLQLVYSIQSRFLRVRTFVFVDIPDDAADFFLNREIEDGIKEMYNRGKFSMSAFSDYGRVFEEFYQKHLHLITRKTTLLVIGDARNNYNHSHADIFQKICEQAKRVIWLNPEPQENWDQEDNIMSVYGQCCDQIFECRNLRQLDVVSRRII